MRSLLFFLIPIAVLLLSLGHKHEGLSPGHAMLHTATVVVAAVLLYVAISGYVRVRTPRFRWLLVAFLLLLARELALSISMYTGYVWHIPHTDIPIDHFIGLVALVAMAYAIFLRPY
ncbi:MAG: hypothetical protein ACK4SY_02090 [Pyrobaculum sp.]